MRAPIANQFMKWADDHHTHPLTKRFKALNKSEEDVLTRDGRFQDIIEDWADLVKHGKEECKKGCFFRRLAAAVASGDEAAATPAAVTAAAIPAARPLLVRKPLPPRPRRPLPQALRLPAKAAEGDVEAAALLSRSGGRGRGGPLQRRQLPIHRRFDLPQRR